MRTSTKVVGAITVVLLLCGAGLVVRSKTIDDRADAAAAERRALKAEREDIVTEVRRIQAAASGPLTAGWDLDARVARSSQSSQAVIRAYNRVIRAFGAVIDQANRGDIAGAKATMRTTGQERLDQLATAVERGDTALARAQTARTSLEDARTEAARERDRD